MTTAVESVGVVPRSVARGLFAGLSLHVEWITGLLVDGASGDLLPVRAIAGRLVHAPASDRGRLDRRALSVAMGLLRRWNGDSPVSRVENVSSQLVPELERLGYRLTPKEPDYLYHATDLAALAGDRYKSQRALCNRF